MTNIPEKNCTNCKNFAWWDGDFVCVKHSKILQTSNGGEFSDDILIALRINKDCKDWEKETNGIYSIEFEKFLNNKK